MKFPMASPSAVRISAAGVTFCLSLALLIACGSYPEAIPCGQIPPDGCPLSRGGTCDDATCAAIYGCVDGVWHHVETCSNMPQDAGTGPDACTIVTIDRTGETTGCKPDLQNPDCPVAAAEQCASTVCQSECIDFFLCTKDGWSVVAYCNEDGEFVTMP